MSVRSRVGLQRDISWVPMMPKSKVLDLRKIFRKGKTKELKGYINWYKETGNGNGTFMPVTVTVTPL